MTRNERILVGVGILYFISATMSNVFVNVYLYAYTGSLMMLISYSFVRYFCIPVGYLIAGQLTRHVRLSVILTTGLVVLSTALGILLTINPYFDQWPVLIYLIGVVFGLGEGLYWFSANNLNQLASTKTTRPAFVSSMGIANAVATIIAPFSATWIVTNSGTDTEGYLRIFQVVIVVQLIASLLASRVTLVHDKARFTLLDKFDLRKDSQWRYIMTSNVLFGIREAVLFVLGGILIFRATGNSGKSYGDLLTMFAVLAIASNAIARKLISRENRMRMYSVGAVLLFIGTMVLVLVPTLEGAIFYGVVNAIGSPFLINPFNIIVMNAIQDYAGPEPLYGRIIARETAWTTGRLIGFTSILLVSWLVPEPLSLVIAVTFCSSSILVLMFYARRYHALREKISN
jgi:MFS transporter, YQGE family, putative transporter